MVADIDVDALMRGRWAMGCDEFCFGPLVRGDMESDTDIDSAFGSALGEASTGKVLERGTEDEWMTSMDTSTSVRQCIFSARDGMCMRPVSSLRYC